MINKRGQITIFIIFAIIIVGAIIVYFSLNNNSKDIVNPATNEIYSFVKDCIKKTGEDAIYQIAQNGGYYLPTKVSTANGIPYYYYSGENLLISKTEIENQLAFYINNNLKYCTGSFEDFPQSSVDSGEVLSEVMIEEGQIKINANYPLIITKNEKTYSLKNFKDIIVRTRFDAIYKSLEKIIKDQLTREDVCLSCITNIALENDLIINIIGLEETTLFVIQDENSKINGVPIKWQFANRY